MATKMLKNISSLEDEDSDEDFYEFLDFYESVSDLYGDQPIQDHLQNHKNDDDHKTGQKRKPDTPLTYSSQFTKVPRLTKSHISPNSFTDHEFHRRYRINKKTFSNLSRVLESREQFIENRSHNPIPLPIQLMIALRYYATGSYQNELCEFFSVHQTTIGRIVHRISSAIEDTLLDFIKMPTCQEELSEIQKEFFNVAQFENVTGVVGARHVPLNSPHGQENILNYKNDNGNYSLVLQIICDSKQKILFIDASSPGSMTNQEVFDACGVQEILESRTKEGVLLGDDSYECGRFILTPIQRPANESEKVYNFFQRKTQICVEKCFEMMTKRFPVLKNGLRVHITKSISIILALGVLHNFCVLYDDSLPDD